MKNSFMTWVYLGAAVVFTALSFLWFERPDVGMMYILVALSFLMLSMLEQIRLGVWRKKKGPQDHKLNLSDKVGTKDGR